MIKVLWVDDQEDIVEGTVKRARRYDIELEWHSNWEEARIIFENNYYNYEAIILDCFCKKSKSLPEDDTFLRDTLRDIANVNGRKHNICPWYILSAGTREDTNVVMKNQVDDSRKVWDKDWEFPYYGKTSVTDIGKKHIDCLFENIKNYVEHKDEFIIRAKYPEVFHVLQSSNINKQAEPLMLNILMAMHMPHKNPSFMPILYYNQLRQLIEYVFRACNVNGILPDECIPNGRVNLQNSYCYLSGRPALNVGVKYDDPENPIFPKAISNIVHEVLSVANTCSHTTELDEKTEEKIDSYLSEINTKYFLFGYALQLCELIIWYGQYAVLHSDINENKSHSVKLTEMSEEDKKHLIEEYSFGAYKIEETKGIIHCDKCLIGWKEAKNYTGRHAYLLSITVNTDARTKYDYPLFARKIEISKSL